MRDNKLNEEEINWSMNASSSDPRAYRSFIRFRNCGLVASIVNQMGSVEELQGKKQDNHISCSSDAVSAQKDRWISLSGIPPPQSDKVIKIAVRNPLDIQVHGSFRHRKIRSAHDVDASFSYRESLQRGFVFCRLR